LKAKCKENRKSINREKVKKKSEKRIKKRDKKIRGKGAFKNTIFK